MTLNAEYLEQKRIIAILEAISSGTSIPQPERPALAYESIEASGDFGFYFNADVAGL